MNFRPLILILLFLQGTALAQMEHAEKEALIARERNSALLLRTSQLSSEASREIDVTYYSLRFTLSTSPNPILLTGDVLVQAVNTADSLSSVTLDLMNPMTVDSAWAGGHRTSFTRSPTTVTLPLGRTYRRGDMLSIRIAYHGVPSATGFGSFYFSQHGAGVPWVWSLSEPYGARDWWPCKDHPSDKADSADIWITCDAAFKAGSNGRLAGVTANGDGTRTWHWEERYPIATYLISIAVTDYAEFTQWFHYAPTDSMPVLNYILPEQMALAKPDLEKTVDMLRIFSDTYGLYPFIKEKYGHATMGRGGAMEHQTMTSTTTYQEYVIAHELGHQWFGDMITCRSWSDLWLNEGFATYSEMVYGERQYGKDFYKGYLNRILGNAKNAVGPLRARDTTSIPQLFAETGVYDKGASVLHMLRYLLGDSTFFRCLKAYAADPQLRYGTAATADLRRICESVSGKPLGYFFDEWTDGEGYPVYTYSWAASRTADGWSVSLHLSQKNSAGASTSFTMPLPFRIAGQAWDTTVTVMNASTVQDFMLAVSHRPLDVRLDPDEQLLADKVNLNDASLPASFRLYQNYPNPFNPGTTIAFDLPSRSHVTLSIYNILGEEVVRLVDGRLEAGRHEIPWDGVLANGTKGPSGVYLVRVTAGEHVETGRMLLLK